MERMQDTIAQYKLECQRQDATLLRKAVLGLWAGFLAGHDPSKDSFELAKLACQTRDARLLKQSAHTLAAAAHAAPSKRGVNCAARA